MTDLASPPIGRRLFHAAGLPMLLVDPETGLIEDVNEALLRFYRRPREELAGQSLTVISRSSPERLRDALAAAASSGQAFAVVHLTAEGREVPVTVAATPVVLDGRRLVLEVITERGPDPDAQAALALLYEATADIHRAIVRTGSEADLWSETSRIIVEVAGFPLAWVAMRAQDDRYTRVTASAGAVAFLEGRVDDLTATDPTLVARAIAEGRTVVYDELVADEAGPYRRRAVDYGFRSGAAVPLGGDDGPPFGALVVLDSRPAALSGERVALLERIAADASVARALLLATERLRASEERYRSIVEQASAGIMVFDTHGRVRDANAAACAMLGYSLDELRTVGSSLMVRDASRSEEADTRDDLDAGAAIWVDRRYRRADGEVITVALQGRRRADGCVEAVVQDVTAERRAVAALRESEARATASEERLRILLEEAFDSVIVAEADGVISYANPATATILGLPRDALIGRSLYDLIPFEHRERLAGDMRAIMSGAVFEGEYPAIRADGAELAVEVTGSRLADGRIEVIARNVTARKALEAERDRLAQAAEQASDAIYITDAGGTISYVNRAYERMNGYLREEAVGRSAEVHLAPEHAGLEAQVSEALVASGAWAGEVTHRAKDGTRFRVSSRVVALRDPGGRVTGRVAIARDISLEREQDARVAQAARLEAIAQLAGGVAHDLNNVLTMIVGHAALLDPLTATPADIAEGVRAITAAAGQAETLTMRLLAFGRRAFLQPRTADLRDLLVDTQPLLARAVGPHVALAVSPGATPTPVSLDPNLFEQALLALAVHARDTMPTGGTVRLAIERPGPGEGLPGVDSAVLVVSDTGPGLAPDALARLFEPFAAVGDDEPGLGLAMAHGFVEQSGGRVEVATARGQGTTFRILLPLAVTAAGPARPAAGQPKRTGPATILVAEDEPVLRLVANRTLTGRGYTVLLAGSGEEALAVAGGHDGRIDLLFSDVVMPGLRGPGLAAALVRSRPDMKVLLTSGYAEDVIGRRGIESTMDEFLPKPYTPSMLAAAVEQLLSSTPD